MNQRSATISENKTLGAKAIIFARVSTQEQETDGHSIDAQIHKLREYCKKNSLTVIKEFGVVESSTKGERPEFNLCLDFIRTQKEKVALVCDKVDRLQRSILDIPKLEELRIKEKVVIHFLDDILLWIAEMNSLLLDAYYGITLILNEFTGKYYNGDNCEKRRQFIFWSLLIRSVTLYDRYFKLLNFSDNDCYYIKYKNIKQYNDMQKLASIPMPSGDIFKDGCSPFDYIHNKIIGLKKREKTEDKGMRNLLLHNILHAKTDECNATFSKDVKSYDVEVNLLSYNQKLKIF